jgi:hypothetical protein
LSNYVKTVDFAAKDSLPTGNPNKVASGTQVDTEFNNIATAVATKEDTANKGIANGYAGLDSGGDVPRAQLPTPVAYEDEANTFTDNQKISISNSGVSHGSGGSFLRTNNTSATGYSGVGFERNGTLVAEISETAGSTSNGGFSFAALVSSVWTTLLTLTNSAFTYKGNTIWHAGNDGSGSGLDADLLDGSNSSAFAAATHNHSAAELTSGSIPDARVPSSNVTQHQASLAIAASQVTAGLNTDASSFSLTSAYNGIITQCNSAGTITITVGVNALGANGRISVFTRVGVGAVTFSATGGAAFRTPGTSGIAVQHGVVGIIQLDSTTYQLCGNV